MFKSVLVPATGAPTDPAVFATALLAAGPAGHVEFLHVRVDLGDILTAVAAGGIGFGSGVTAQEDIDRLDREEIDQAEAAHSAVAAFCAQAGVPLDQTTAAGARSAAFIVETGSPPQYLADHGRFADLIVVGRGDPEKGGSDAESIEGPLLETGRPMLIAPPVAPASLTDTVVIGWTDTPQTARAIAAAMPLIDAAKQVVIVSVHAEDEPDPTTERLARALGWHNANVTVRHVPQDQGNAAASLLKMASVLGASVLVMGGFSHSPLRELLFGGATKSVMASAAFPVLMAH